MSFDDRKRTFTWRATQCSSRKKSASTCSSPSTAAKISVSMPSLQWRWPNGFLCPHCAHDRCCQLNTRKLQQCNRCHRQTSMTAGTIFDSTKRPLTVWFQGLYFMTQGKKGALRRCTANLAAPTTPPSACTTS